MTEMNMRTKYITMKMYQIKVFFLCIYQIENFEFNYHVKLELNNSIKQIWE